MLRDACSKASRAWRRSNLNGDLDHRVPHNLNVSFNFVEANP